jgi:hypothetical protein
MEMVAVKGVAVAEGQVIMPGGSIDETNETLDDSSGKNGH